MYGWHDNGWWIGFFMMLLVLAAVVLVVWLVTRSVVSGEQTRPQAPRPDLRPDAMDILRERFARGEIDAEEFETRRALLEGKGT